MKQSYKQSRELLGSQITLTVCDEAAKKNEVEHAIQAAFSECERIEKQFSRFIKTSELSELNQRIDEPTKVSEECFLLLEFAEQIKQATRGAFDISVHSVLAGWGYDAEYSLQEKSKGEIGPIVLDRANLSVTLSAPIDFGGIGKGYALDRMLPFFEGFSNILLDAGGDLYARGTDENNKAWKILFEHPSDTNKAIGHVQTAQMFFAASSPSRRTWRNRHHLVHPLNKAPADDMSMTYIQAPKGIIADALATALFVLGWEQAITVLPELGAEAMLISKNGKIFRSKGFEGELYASR